MSEGENCEKSHRLCDAGLGETEASGGGEQTNDLPSEVWLVVGLFASTSQTPAVKMLLA